MPDGPHGLVRHLLGALLEEARHVAGLCIRALLKLGPRDTWTHAEHADAGAAQLDREGLAEAEDEGLGRGVGRHVGTRSIRADRRDVHHHAPPAAHHRRQQPSGELDERFDVERDLLQLSLDGQGVEEPDRPEPGVVHQPIDVESAVTELLDERGDRAGPRQVGRQDIDLDGVRGAQLRGQCRETFRTARHQSQMQAVARQPPSQRLADAARRPRDERDLSCHSRRAGYHAAPPVDSPRPAGPSEADAWPT
jgi:hypothetical protein